MPKKPDTYHRPDTLNEALQLLAQPDTFVLAGGTRLLAGDVNGSVVDLQALGLNQVEWRNGRLHIGATTTLTSVNQALADQPGETPAALLQTATAYAGPNTYRNAATLGGIIASRLPDSELLAALLVLEAELLFAGHVANRLSLADYLSADERPSGLITQIQLPWENGRGGSERVARTPKDSPIVSVTGWQPDGRKWRLAATGASERPFRLIKVEQDLADGRLDQAIESAPQSCTHPGDFRGDAKYRAEMTAVLTRRLLLAHP